MPNIYINNLLSVDMLQIIFIPLYRNLHLICNPWLEYIWQQCRCKHNLVNITSL